jgi:hypothetical protein
MHSVNGALMTVTTSQVVLKKPSVTVTVTEAAALTNCTDLFCRMGAAFGIIASGNVGAAIGGLACLACLSKRHFRLSEVPQHIAG